MSTVASIARLRDGGSTWALGALRGDDAALERLGGALLQRWRSGDRLVVLGNMLGAAGHTPRTIDLMLLLRRRLLARRGAEVEDFVFLRGGQEEMWHKVLQLQFALAPLDVLDWMLARGLADIIEAYGYSIAEGRIACRNGPLAIARWTTGLREMLRRAAGHNELLASLRRAALTDGGELLFVSAGIDPSRPLGEQGDTFWWGSGYMSNVTEPYAGFRLVVRGYDRARQPASVGHVVASLDGGAGFGGTLNAVCFSLDGQPVDWIEA